MSGNNYQKHSFLVFENTQSVLSLQDLEVFKTGAQLPWSFYTVTVSLDNEGVTGNSGGYSKILMTAESKDAGNRKAGVAVTKLRTYENGKEKFITAEDGKEVTVEDYKACGWPITYTEDGDAILPSYGEFTFCKGYTPDFEDASQIIMNLQIGFGLNGTIYNYQDAEVSIGVHNLSVQPEMFISTKNNSSVDITYSATDKKWTRKIAGTTDDTFKQLEYDPTGKTFVNYNDATIYEGTNTESDDSPYLYLFVKVEKSEGIRIDMHESSKELEIAATNVGSVLAATNLSNLQNSTNLSSTGDFTTLAANSFVDVQNDGTNKVRSVYLSKPNTSLSSKTGEKIEKLGSIGENLDMSFYVIRIGATTDFNQFSYVGSKKLSQTFSITPIPDDADSDTLKVFKRTLNLGVSLLPSTSSVYIRDDLSTSVHNFYDHEKSTAATATGFADLSDQSNLRHRVVVTAEEAIHYAYNTDDTSFKFYKDAKDAKKTAEEAYSEYKKSILTQVEKDFYTYKESFNDDAKLQRLCIYCAMDLSGDIKENFSNDWKDHMFEKDDTYEATDMSGPIDLSQAYYLGGTAENASLFDLRQAIHKNIVSLGEKPTLAKIQQTCSEQLGGALALFKVRTRTADFNLEYSNGTSIDEDKQYDQSHIPWTDSRLFDRQRVGDIVDSSEGKFLAEKSVADRKFIRNTMLGHPSSLLTILFGLNEARNGVFDPKNKMLDYYNMSTTSQVPAHKIATVIQELYHQGTAFGKVSLSTVADVSGVSSNRPSATYDEVKAYRRKINPVNGSYSIEYLTKGMKILDTKGNDKYYFGTDAIYKAYDKEDKIRSPSKDDIKCLLYKGGIATQINGSDTSKLLSTTDLVGGEFKVSNPALTAGYSTGAEKIDTYVFTKKIYGYSSSNPSGDADQSAVFYTHFRFSDPADEDSYFVANDSSQISTSLGFYGDASGVVTSFYKDNKERDTTNTMYNKWVFTKYHGLPDATSTSAPGDTTQAADTYEINSEQKAWYGTANGAYSTSSRQTEGNDFSGIIKFPRSVDAKYYDVFVTFAGKEYEIKESVIDVEELFESGFCNSDSKYLFDMSNLEYFSTSAISAGTAEYNRRPEMLRYDSAGYNNLPTVKVGNKDLTTTDVNEAQFKYDILKIPGCPFHFFRIGSIVRILSNGADIDADRKDNQPLPQITFRLHGASKGLGDKNYELYVYSQDKASALDFDINVNRAWSSGFSYGIKSGGEGGNDLPAGEESFKSDASGVFINQYNKAIIPFDVSGMFEAGENLTFTMKNDVYKTSSDDISNVSSGDIVNDFETYFGTNISQYSSMEAANNARAAYKFQILYKMIDPNTGKYPDEWTTYNGESFTYECHNKQTFTSDTYNTGISGFNSHADSGINQKVGKDAVSSNIKGKPKFAFCLPAQKGGDYGLTEIKDHSKIISDNSTKKTLGRRVTVTMSCTNNKIKNNKPVKTMTDKTLNVYAFVNAYAYDPNLTVTETKYNSSKVTFTNSKGAEFTPGDITYGKHYKAQRAYTDGANPQTGYSSSLNPPLPGRRAEFSKLLIPKIEKIKHLGTDHLQAKKFTDNHISNFEVADYGDDFLSYYTIDLTNKSARDVSSIDLSASEYLSGESQPIAVINYDADVNVGNNEISAEIVPLFRLLEDHANYKDSSDKENFKVKETGGKTTDGLDFNSSAPLFIPANNKRYGVKVYNGQISLYRKQKEEYSYWRSRDWFDTNATTKFGSLAYPELVSVEVKYTTPNNNAVCSKFINFFVRPKNENGLRFINPRNGKPTSNFHFEVENGAESLDITEVFNAKMPYSYLDGSNPAQLIKEEDNEKGNVLVQNGGNYDIATVDEKIKYVVVGFVDASGRTMIYPEHFSNDTASNYEILTDVSNCIDASNVYNIEVGNYSGDPTKMSFQRGTSPDDVAAHDQSNVDIMSFKSQNPGGSNWKINLYHVNYSQRLSQISNNYSADGTPVYVTNNLFNVYDKQNHQFLVMAYYDHESSTTDLSETERALALVTVDVKEKNSGFYFSDTTGKTDEQIRSYYKQETLGSIAEGKTELENNPEIALSTFTDKITHPNATASNVTYKVESLDSNLIVCPPTLADDNNNAQDERTVAFGDLVVKLKNTLVNRTNETVKGGKFTHNEYPHYNYERQNKYKIQISAKINKFTELYVTKKGPTFICDLYRDANSADVVNGAVTSKSSKACTYLVNSTKPDGSTQATPVNDDVSGNCYYFKDSETGKYQGPFVLTPRNINDLQEKKEIHGVDVPYSYLRWDNGSDEDVEQRFLPLYKGAGFSALHNEPPIDINGAASNFDFFIKVTDTFDLAKQSPQPYIIKNGAAADSDPAGENCTLIDPATIRPESIRNDGSEQLICYVFADYNDLDGNDKLDFPRKSKKPSWATDFSAITPANSTVNDISQVTRKVHPYAGICEPKTSEKTLGKFESTAVASASTSAPMLANRGIYGTFPDDIYSDQNTQAIDASAGIFLDMFIEYPSTSDASGWNHINRPDVQPFGEPVDYSMNLPTGKYGLGNGSTSITYIPDANSSKRTYRLQDICRHERHDNNSDGISSYYIKGALKTASGYNSFVSGQAYKFVVAAVSNKLATVNDQSYNENMVDKDGFLTSKTTLPNVPTQPDWLEKKKVPVHYQKYVYDPSGGIVRTYAQARSLMGDEELYSAHADNANIYDISNNYPNAIKAVDLPVTDVSDLGAFVRSSTEYTNGYAYDVVDEDTSGVRYTYTPGALFTCRTKFVVTFASVNQTATASSSSASGVSEVYTARTIVNGQITEWETAPTVPTNLALNQAYSVDFTHSSFNGVIKKATYSGSTKKWTYSA